MRTILIAILLALATALAGCSTQPREYGDVMPTITLHEIPVTNGTIHVDEIAGRGEAVLLIHGGFGDSRMWNAQFPDVMPGARVVRMDLRGFGGSSFPTTAYSAIDDVLAVLDALRIDKAHIVGNSMGGALAIDFALAHPERVASIVVESSGPNGYPSAEERGRFQADLDAISAVFEAVGNEGVARGAELWKQQPMVAVAHADPNVAPLLHQMIDDNQRIFTMQFWPDDDKRAVGRLGELRVPTLFVVGDRDIALVRAAVAYGAAHIAGARVVTIAGTDHLPHMEKPGEFNAVVAAFIRKRASGAH